MNNISSPQTTGESIERILQNHSTAPRIDLAYSVTAQRLYEAFAQYGPLFRGLPLAWDQLDDETQAAWIAAARAI